MTEPRHLADPLTIAARFRGPPASGNGGYVCGAVAEHLAACEPAPPGCAAEVTLRAPPPLDRPLAVRAGSAAGIEVHDGGTLVGTAVWTPIDPQVPSPPTIAEAGACASGSPSFWTGVNPLLPAGRGFHPVCFCCGADAIDGLRVFAGPVADRSQVAALWHADAAWADPAGMLPAAFVWAALDCPGQFAWMAADTVTGLLGRMTARINRPVAAGRDYRITGWRVGQDGRKFLAGTALWDDDGHCLAWSRQTWVGERPGGIAALRAAATAVEAAAGTGRPD